MQCYDMVIVGGGHGGAQLAIALRQGGYPGTIAIVGGEPDAPYERPPLSKGYLSGTIDFERLLIRPLSFWRERDVTLRLGVRVEGLDPSARTVTLADGAQIGYRTLTWAAGGAPRLLSCEGHGLAGVHAVRTRRDVDRLLSELPAVTRVVVVGGGYIGLEAAAVLTKLGRSVTVIEAQDRVLARVCGEPLSHFVAAEHRAQGVDVRLGQVVAAIEGRDGRVVGVRLGNGGVIPCHMVIVGIGIIPEVMPLRAAGALGTDGVAVDHLCRTTLPDVFAIGDCALHFNVHANGPSIRLESVQNAAEMAKTVAKAAMGGDEPYTAVPWFWSDQYDLRLQTVGLSRNYDDVVVRGDPATRSFSLVYLRAGKVRALDCVNAARDFAQGRALVLAEASPSRLALADTSIPLKALAASASRLDA